MSDWLEEQGNSAALIKRALTELDRASALGQGRSLAAANKDVYRLPLRREGQGGAGEQNKTVWLIDWENLRTITSRLPKRFRSRASNKKRPDIVLYVNGLALGVIELKRSSVSVAEGIRQNLDNQKKTFIRNFFTTMQLVMAGNDTEGLRYGTIETPERHFYQWKEDVENVFDNPLDFS